MEFIEELIVEDQDWFLESDLVKFLPGTTGFEISNYGFEIRDSEYIVDTYLIVVFFEVNIINPTINETVFHVKIVGGQKFNMNDNKVPDNLSCFDVIKRTWEEFNLLIDNKATNSIISTLPRPIPKYDELKDQIDASIDTWDKYRSGKNLS